MPRNYKAEYRRRIARGRARGLSRSQARGHPKAKEQSIKAASSIADDKIDAAILDMHHGESLSAAARSSHISAERLSRFLAQGRLAKLRGRRWIMSDDRPRRVPVMTGGRQRSITVQGFDEASLVGKHHNAVGAFVRNNDISLLEPFVGQFVRTAKGKRILLETDPNELHRIAAMDTPAFCELPNHFDNLKEST